MDEIIAVFGVDWRLLVIQAINFTLLLIVLWYFLYRPVIVMIEKRQEKIARGVSDAEAASKELAEAEDRRRSILTTASKEAEDIIVSAKDQAEERRGQIVKDAEKRSDDIFKDAQTRAEELKQKTLDESREEIARMVVLGAEKVLREKQS